MTGTTMRFWPYLAVCLTSCLAWCLVSGPALGAGVKITWPSEGKALDPRFNDLLEILRTALDETVADFGPYELTASPTPMNEARYLAEIRDAKTVNIVWSSTSMEKERDLLPLRIPLRKGLLGYRVAFTAKGNQAKIDKVKTLTDLKTLTIGQGIGWGDVALYTANGIKVQTANYELLFKMTNSGRFDIFPRGIGEIGPELAANSADNPDLVVEKNLLIYYPWPYYFFFNKADTALHNRIGRGIRKMMENGKFDAIFNKYNAKAIQDANLKNRRLIRIENPNLPKDTPLNDAKLWFDPLKF